LIEEANGPSPRPPSPWHEAQCFMYVLRPRSMLGESGEGAWALSDKVI